MADKVTNADTLLERLRIAGARLRILSTDAGDGEQVTLERVSLVEPLGPLDAYTDVHVGAYKALVKRGVLAYGADSSWPLEHGKMRIEQFATLKPEPEVAHDPAALLIDGIAIAAIPVGVDDSVEEDDEGMVIISVIVKGISTPIVRFPIDGHVRGVFSPDDIRAAIAREHGGSAALTREPVKSRAKRSKKEPRVVIATEHGADIGTMEPGEEVIAVFPGKVTQVTAVLGDGEPYQIVTRGPGSDAAEKAEEAFGTGSSMEGGPACLAGLLP